MAAADRKTDTDDKLALVRFRGRANTVRLGKRVIGFMCQFKLRGVDGWRFISNREDIAAKMPVPATVHDTPEAALGGVAAALGGSN